MEVDKKKMGLMTEKRGIFGIPPLVLLVVIAGFGAMSYYTMSFMSENKLIMQKYQDTRGKLLMYSRLAERTGRKVKVCENNLKSSEASNRELLAKTEKKEGEVLAIRREKDICASRLSQAHHFYISAKEVLNVTAVSESKEDGDIPASTYELLKNAMNDLKSFKEKYVELKKQYQELKSTHKELNNKLHNIESQVSAVQNENAKLKEENSGTRKLNSELQQKVDTLEEASHKRGIQQEKVVSLQPNVRMENLNKQPGDENVNVKDSNNILTSRISHLKKTSPSTKLKNKTGMLQSNSTIPTEEETGNAHERSEKTTEGKDAKLLNVSDEETISKTTKSPIIQKLSNSTATEKAVEASTSTKTKPTLSTKSVDLSLEREEEEESHAETLENENGDDNKREQEKNAKGENELDAEEPEV